MAKLTKHEREKRSIRLKELKRLKRLAEEKDALEKALRYEEHYKDDLAGMKQWVRHLNDKYPKIFQQMHHDHPKRKDETLLDYYHRLVSFIVKKVKTPKDGDSPWDHMKRNASLGSFPISQAMRDAYEQERQLRNDARD